MSTPVVHFVGRKERVQMLIKQTVWLSSLLPKDLPDTFGIAASGFTSSQVVSQTGRCVEVKIKL